MAALVLGGVVFEGFELPNNVSLGGKQAGRMHKMPGGLRVFDAQGPDDEPIKWSGRFRGAEAMARTMRLDAMRRQGAQLELFVLGLAYTVVIASFEFKPARAGIEIPYSICLEVIEDLSQGVGGLPTMSLTTAVAADIASALKALA